MPTKTLNITLAESEYEDARAVKDELDLTWEEFVIEATDALDGQRREKDGHE